MIIGISGYARAGKDTLANEICSRYPQFGIRRFSDGVKDFLLRVNPEVCGTLIQDLFKDEWQGSWERAKDSFVYGDEVRRLLQTTGTDAARGLLGEDVWVNYLMSSIDPYAFTVVPDVRFPNEADAILQHPCGVLIRVERPGFPPINDHPSERALDHYDHADNPVRYVCNDGTPGSLFEQAERALDLSHEIG